MNVPADAIAAVAHPDPYPYYRTLTQHTALAWDARLRLWIAAHPALVRDVMMHPDCRVRPPHDPVPASIAGPAGDVFGALARMRDGAPHAARRTAIERVLATWTDDKVAYQARRVATMLLAGGIGTAAQLNAFVLAMPVCTTASLLGVADTDLRQVAGWTGQFAACLSPLATAPQVAAAHSATQALLAALHTLPVAQGARDGDMLRANLLGVLSQTYEATAGLLGNCIAALLRGAAPAELVTTTLHADPSIHNTRRFAARDAVIGSVTVPAGQGILLILAAAGAEHGFGHGSHRCPGHTIARIMVAQAVDVLATTQVLPRVAWRYQPSVNARIPVFMELQ